MPEYDEFLKQTDTVEGLAARAYDNPSKFEGILFDIDDVLKEPVEASVGYQAAITAADEDYVLPDLGEKSEKPVIKFGDGVREFMDKTVPSWTHTVTRSPVDVRTESGWFRAYFGADQGGKELHSDQLEHLRVRLPSKDALSVYRGDIGPVAESGLEEVAENGENLNNLDHLF